MRNIVRDGADCRVGRLRSVAGQPKVLIQGVDGNRIVGGSRREHRVRWFVRCGELGFGFERLGELQCNNKRGGQEQQKSNIFKHEK